MQKADTTRMDEATATSCMEKLLADFEPCHFMPLLLKAAAVSHTPDVQVKLGHTCPDVPALPSHPDHSS